MEPLYVHVNAKMWAENCREVDLKIIQTRVLPEKLNDKFVVLCLMCKATTIGTILCGIDINESGRAMRYGGVSPMG